MAICWIMLSDLEIIKKCLVEIHFNSYLIFLEVLTFIFEVQLL